jgi:phenylacetate-CoA ligase
MTYWLHKAFWNAFTLWQVRREARLPYRPLADLLTLQNRRVRSMIAHAYASVPYYREVMDDAGLRPTDFHTADDLARLPLLSGDLVARDPERFLSQRRRGGRCLALHSSGTHGRYRRIYYDPAALFLALAHGHRQRLVMAKFTGRVTGYREMVVARPGNIGRKIRDFYETYSWMPKWMDLSRSRLSPGDALDDNVQTFNSVKPDVLHGYGSYVGIFFRHAWEQRLPLHRPKLVTYGGDRMVEADRQLIETEFQTPVLSSYQAAEALRIGFQCERRQGFHLNLDHIAVRVIDKSGNAVAPGSSGEIVLSNLTNRATVLLNYKQGDVVTLSASACPCGRTLPTIEQIDGRADDLLVLPDGRMMHALVVQAPLHRIPGVIQVQLIQHALQHFTVNAVYIGAADWAATRRQMEETLQMLLGKNVVVSTQRVEHIPHGPSGKLKAVISHVR